MGIEGAGGSFWNPPAAGQRGRSQAGPVALRVAARRKTKPQGVPARRGMAFGSGLRVCGARC